MPIDLKVSVPIAYIIKPAIWAYKKANNFHLKYIQRLTYFFEEYVRQVTIYQNGHGIIYNKFVTHVLNKEKFTSFNRFIDIHDSCVDTKFGTIDEMKEVNAVDRFSKMGFWYEPHDLINNIVSIVNEPKRLEWEFFFNKTEISNMNPPIFDISYSMSIPGMFPITDCCFDSFKAPSSDNTCRSSSAVLHKINKLTFIIAIEKGIDIEQYPTCKLFSHGTDQGEYKEIKLDDDSDIFYNRYKGIIKNPKMGATTAVEWKVRRESKKQ